MDSKVHLLPQKKRNESKTKVYFCMKTSLHEDTVSLTVIFARE